MATGVEATNDSVFQIGSITKVWTATLVMQLVDEDLIDLDVPLRRYVPEFRLRDESAAAEITVRQLLSHTAGFEGDIFTDTGKGDDAVQKFLAELADVPQLFPPGEQFSYNNAGYCVLGRLIEKVRGIPFDECLREYLIAPLGLGHAATAADEAIMFRAAVGHVTSGPDGALVPAPIWSMARSNSPAGSMLTMSARDLLTFARMHLGTGVAADGARVLSTLSAIAMQERQVELPALGLMGNAWGLGWEIYDTPGPTIVGHDGNTIGQAAFMRIVPDRDLAIVLLTNGGESVPLYLDIFDHVLRDLAGIGLPPLPVPPAQWDRIDATRYVGTYSCEVADMKVTAGEDGRIFVQQVPKGVFAEIGAPLAATELVCWDRHTLIPLEPQQGMYQPHAFIGDDGTGRAQYLHVGRALPRVDV
jgi:CubicO group peptidase (beta-lactamase class C family)